MEKETTIIVLTSPLLRLFCCHSYRVKYFYEYYYLRFTNLIMEYTYYLFILWSLILLKCIRTTNVQNLMHGKYDLNRHEKQDHGVVF